MGILRTNTVSGIETPTPVTGSVLFDGSGDFLDLSSPEFAIGNADFTIECWYKLSSYPTNYYIFDLHTGGNGIRFQLYDGGVAGQAKTYWITSTGTFYESAINQFTELNKWYHIVMTRKGTTVYAFMDGILQGTFTVADNFAHTSLRIGCYGAATTQGFDGYISNFRILKGTALYTSNFTPPTRELQRIGDTVLLCCNNPDSAGAEATGKTITVNGNAAASTFSPGLVRDFTFGTQFDGVTKFDTQGYFIPPSGTTEQRSRGRGLFAVNAVIDYIQIQSQGNAIDFGDMSASAANGSGLGSPTRGVFGGFGSPIINTIEYVTFSTTSNSLDFGDLTTNRWGTGSTSNNTRGIFYAGYNPSTTLNVTKIDYITIATLGSAATFGDATTAVRTLGGCGSSTRGIFAGGVGGTYQEIEYITLSTLGNSVTFGNLSQARFGAAASSSSTRAIFSGGYQYPGPALTNLIDYITIASTGNAQDFGDLTRANWSVSGTSNSIRGVVAGGYVAPANNNTIDYVTIASTGNAQDFGDMTSSKSSYAAFSDSHGGLS